MQMQPKLSQSGNKGSKLIACERCDNEVNYKQQRAYEAKQWPELNDGVYNVSRYAT